MIFTQILLVLVGTTALLISLKRIVNKKSKTVADYVILILYVFNVLPILLDILFGLPEYTGLFTVFYDGMKNLSVSIIYDIYMIITLLVLLLYAKIIRPRKIINHDSNNNNAFKIILFITSLLPVIQVILSGHYSAFFTYTTNTERGLPNSFITLNSHLILLSILAFGTLFFNGKKMTKTRLTILTIHSFLTLWIGGKRFILVTMIIVYMFYYLNTSKAVNKRKIIIFILSSFVLVVVYFLSYTILVKKTMTGLDFSSAYTSLRINFGRDDVIKFVMYKEHILNNPIIDYRGQTILSTFLFFIPRSIWPSKPFPHYRYLTAAIIHVPVEYVHFGMTPSLFEMTISNFGLLFGLIFAILLILLFMYRADKASTISVRIIYLMIVIVLLTQNIDIIASYIILLFVITIRSFVNILFTYRNEALLSYERHLK